MFPTILRVFIIVSWITIATVSAQSEAAQKTLPDQAILLNELTAQYTVSYQQHQYLQATSVAEQALKTAEQAFGSQDAHVAQVLNDLGKLYFVQEQLARAKPLYQRALRIREQVFQSDGPAVAQSLYNLAQLYDAQGQYGKAEPIWKRSLAILERNVAPTDAYLAVVVEKYTASLRSNGKLEEAQQLEQRFPKPQSSPATTTP